MESFASYNSRNIFEHFTNKRALFLCIDALDFKSKSSGEAAPRLKIRCCDYDTSKPTYQRITSEVDAYIPISKFMLLSHDVLSGVYFRQKQARTAQPKPGDKYLPYFEYFGGSSQYDRQTPHIISTRFALVNGMGNDAEFAFLATSGPGKISGTGGIIPLPKDEGGSSPTQSIFINMPNDTLKEFCLIGTAYIEQFIAFDLEARLNVVRSQRSAYLQNRQEGAG